MKGYDASTPVYPPGFDVCFFYIGGDTPHPWSDSEVERIRTRYRVPIYTRYPVDNHTGHEDATEALTWMLKHGQPQGTVVALDFETGVNAAYVEAFDSVIRSGGYSTLLYGSESTLFQNPATSGGYWLALPGATEIDPRCRATQYAEDVNGGQWDESLVSSMLPMWDTSNDNKMGYTEMLMCFVAQTPTENPGIWLLDGGKYVHIPNGADVAALQAAGVMSAHISLDLHNNLLGRVE